MQFYSLAYVATLASAVLGCPQHTNNERSHLVGRQSNPAQNPNSNTTRNIWAYEVSVLKLSIGITFTYSPDRLLSIGAN